MTDFESRANAMPKDTTATPADAKQRLDTLIANARNQLLMPLTIAEALHKIAEGTASLDDIDAIRKKSYHWCATINSRLFGKALSLNRSYWDKLYSDHMPPPAFAALAAENKRSGGIAEAYVYARLRQTVESLRPVRNTLVKGAAGGFELVAFLSAFEQDPKLRRSVDKAYEVVVHALFNAIASRVRAQVTISVSATEAEVMADFQDFCQLLLGVDAVTTSVSVPARLYRVGGTNSRDGGVDLWANFGPAIQVKHISLDAQNTQPIVESISAEQIVIVCKDADKAAIQAVLTQVGLGGRVRGIITKADLARWYHLALGPKHAADMAIPLFESLVAEFDDEFTLADPTAIDKLTKERGYDRLKLEGAWSVAQPVTRAVKPKKPKLQPNSRAKKGK